MAAATAILTAQSDPPGRVGRLNYTQGPVSFQPAGVEDWVEAGINRPLIPGDSIWVGDGGRAELHVGSAALRLGPNTAFEFLNLDDQTVQIRLSEGTLSIHLRDLGQNQVFEIDTPNVAFTMIRPGEYRVDANPDSQTTLITVRDGEGEVTGGDQTFPLYARQQVEVRDGDALSYRLASIPGADAWDQWCAARDRREDQSLSARYVSREVPGYEDLDEYGRWDNQPGYGNVWMPTSVAADWAPYHDGHWAWIAPWGWTWVDDAPWGFAPYHYGRWASFGGRWGWVPGPYGVTPIYAPALVAWMGGARGGAGLSLSFSIGSAAAIGWFPLGPREPYFPSYRVSQGYFTRVNNTNTVFNNTTINNYYNDSRNANPSAFANIRYMNRNVRNGVTAVPQSTFASGRRVTSEARAMPQSQLTAAQVFAAPTVAPRRESVLGARASTASRASRPPANVQNRPVVARTPPPPAAAPFERQQPALAQNPGRPLAPNTVQGTRNPNVRVVDMGRVRRVQPSAGGNPQQNPAVRPAPQTQPQQTQPQQTQPQQTQEVRPRIERPQVAPQQRQQTQQPQVVRPQIERPQPIERERQQPQPRVVRPPLERPQPPVTPSQPPEVVRPPIEKPQPAERERPQQKPRVERQQPPATERQQAPRERQQPSQPVPQQVEKPQPEPTQSPRQAEPRENRGKGKQKREDNNQKKPNF